MASPGNPNQAAAFEMHKLFKPTSPSPQNPNNLNSSSPFPPSAYPPPPSASYPPPSGPYSYPPQTSPPFHHQHHYHMPYSQEQLSNMHHQRSVSFPTPLLQPPPHHLAPPNPNPGARLMALLTPPTTNLDLTQQPVVPVAPIQQPPSGVPEFAASPNVPILPCAPPRGIPNPAVVSASPARMPSSKLPKGRRLVGENVVYDVDVRLQGEVQPQLEVTPITKYVSDPGLVLGRQIAVNKTYICYGLKQGAIRVLNINTALRYLLRGHGQRVNDMAFFAEDVHLLASASINGRVYVWKISEGPDEEDKPQITGKIVIAIQIGEGESVNPRVCWHCHKQEVLVVGIGKRVLKIDTTKVGKGKSCSADEPLNCPVDELIDGVQFIGKHDGEVTDLSMCQWMTTRLVSASTDGTIKIWEDRKALPLLVLRPHDGHPVNSATFLTAPHRPDHIILITAGPLNREVKLWASESEEGWLLPSDAESWRCTQTLDLKSSAEPCVEDAFFNQVLALSKSGLLLLANAKKNAIYAVHLEYGSNPAATCMDYIAEFTVTMPILSFTGTSELLHGEHIVQVYCFQTQAIQQYALNVSQCLPLLPESVVVERSDTGVSHEMTNAEGFGMLEPSGSKLAEMPLTSSALKSATQMSSSQNEPGVRYPVTSTSIESATFSSESKPGVLHSVNNGNDIVPVPSSPLPLSPRLSRKLSGFRSPTSNFEPGPTPGDRGEGDQVVIDYSVNRQMDTVCTALPELPSLDDDSRNDENKAAQDDSSAILNPAIMFKHPTHLITPSEIFMAVSSAEATHSTESRGEGEANIQDVCVNSDVRNVEVEVKVVGETESTQNDEFGLQRESQNLAFENKEKSFCSQASDIGIEMAKDCSALSSETFVVEGSRQFDGVRMEALTQPSNAVEEEVIDSMKDVSGRVADPSMPTTVPQSPAPTTKGKKHKGKNSQVSPSPTAFNSTDSSNEPSANLSSPSVEATVPQILAMQDTLNQLLSMHKEMQKQISILVAVPVTKEGRRLEATLGRSMEKCLKANADALLANIQEDNVKHEKLLRDRTQQITSLINSLNKDFPAILEKTVKKEIAAVVPAVARTITPVVEKTISSAITETFQRGVGDKAFNQLEKSMNSKLEATVARQIQVQFQTSGKQALQDALKSNLEASVIPAFEMSCKAMFDQVDSTFHKGMVEHATTVQQQFESTHSPLALALRDAMNSASSITQTLSGELADGQRKLLALAAAGANSTSVNPLVTQLSNGPLGGLHDKVEVPLDPTKELSRLISECKYEEAFTGALQRSDVSIVSWLCSQVDLQGILSVVPLPLSQGVLLSLLQQLACDINKDTPRKLGWMTDVAVAINPGDPMIAMHVRPIFDQVYQILNHHRALPTTSSSQLQSVRLLMHVINSMLMTCK